MQGDERGRDEFPLEGAATANATQSPPTTPPAEEGMEDLLRGDAFAFRSLKRGETIEGTIVRIDQDEVMVDIGLKSEGVIPARELQGEGEAPPTLHVGEKTLVYVLEPEGGEGHARLSLRRARAERAWRDIEDLYHKGAVLQAPVVSYNKGGLLVDVRGIQGFVPDSQVLDLRNLGRQEAEGDEASDTRATMVGRELSVKIIEINRSRSRLILSERGAALDMRAQRKNELINQLSPGQIREGVVSNITTFGAFVDLGGADGLVHVSELSYNRVNHPNEILQVGQKINVAVLSVDQESRKIALSLKRARPDPWTTLEDRYRLGQVVPAVITKLAKFGAFAQIEEGLEGLIHVSELTDLPVQDPAQVVQEGQHVDAKIIQINSQRRRLGLSMRQTSSLRPQVESFGEVDEISPFATEELNLPQNGVQLDQVGSMTAVQDQPIEPVPDAGDSSSSYSPLDAEAPSTDNAEEVEVGAPRVDFVAGNFPATQNIEMEADDSAIVAPEAVPNAEEPEQLEMTKATVPGATGE